MVGFMTPLAWACAGSVLAQTANRPHSLPTEAASPDSSAAVRSLLSVLPTSDSVALVIPDLARLDDSLGAIAPRLGSGPLLSPLQWLRKRAEIVAGVDEHGAAAVTLGLTDPAAHFSRNLTLWIPTTDRDQLFTFLNPSPQESGFVRVRISGQEAFAAARGAHTVIGADTAMLRRVLDSPAGAVSALSNGQLERLVTSDFALQLTGVRGGSSGLPSRLPWTSELFGLSHLNAEALRAAVWTARIGSDGVAVALHRVSERPTSPAVVSGQGPTLVGLSDEPFIMAVTSRNTSAGPGALAFGGLAISAGVTAEIIDAMRAPELARRIEALTAPVVAQSFALSFSEAPPATLLATVVLQTRSQEAQVTSDIESLVSLLKRGPFVDPRVNRLMEMAELRRAAERIAGVSVDHLTIRAGEANRIATQTTTRIFGLEGFLVRIGWAAPDVLLMTIGGGTERFAHAVQLIREGRAPLHANPLIANVAQRMPRMRNMEAYVSLDRLQRAASFLVGETQRTPDSALPVAPMWLAGIDADPGELRLEGFIPVEALKSLIGAPDASAP